MAKIGIFGGTFNPVHTGHMQMAHCIIKNTDVDKIVFVPNGNPPHKTNKIIADAHHRYNMLLLATEGNKSFEVSDYEISKPGPCYTVDTIRHFKKQNPQHSFCFIIGADSLDYIDKWMDAQSLIAENEFVVINRNFKQNYNLDKNIEYILSLGGKVKKADMTAVDVSSSQIRAMIQNGIDIESLVGQKVNEYILTNKLYLGRNE